MKSSHDQRTADRLLSNRPPSAGGALWRAKLYNADDASERLNPGGGPVKALLRHWDHAVDDYAQSRGSTMIYEPEDAEYGRNFALPNETVTVRLNTSNGRFETVGTFGLFRKARIYDTSIAQDASGLVSIWVAGAVTNPLQQVTAWNDWMDLGDLDQDQEVYIRYFPDQEKWVIIAVNTATKWIKFTLTESMATTDENAEAQVELASWTDAAVDDVTVHNLDESGGDYVFEGDNGDWGIALYRPVDGTWHIIQMECP